MTNSGNKYHRVIHDINGIEIGVVDCYCILQACEVQHPAIAHAAKKVLFAGLRQKGSQRQDIEEAIDALKRALVDLDDETGEMKLEQRR